MSLFVLWNNRQIQPTMQVREAIARYNAQQYAPRGSEWDSFYEPIQEHNDKEMIADALTDPTPLTVERLVDRGYVHDAIRWPGRPDVPCLRRGKLYVYSTEHTDPRSWSWDHDDAGPSIWHVPRTVGELAHLLTMMEGR